MRIERLLVGTLLALFAVSGHAALYKWVDEKGRVQYSDKPPADTSKGGVEMSNRGIVKKKLDAAVSAEEKKAQEAEATRRRDQQQAEFVQRRSDTALLQSFSNAHEIDMKRDRELQAIEAMIANLQGQERTLIERLNEDRSRFDAQMKKGKPPGDGLKQDLLRTESEVKVVREEMQRRKQDAADTRVKYDVLKKRYIELREPGTTAEITPASASAPTAPSPQKSPRK